MPDLSGISIYWVGALVLVGTFACAFLLRAKGITGLLALLGMALIAVLVITAYQECRIAVAGVAALVGLTAGTQFSDRRHAEKMRREEEEAQRRRERGRGVRG